jgi:hypothetical protein
VWVAAGGRCTICNRYLVDDEFTGAEVSVGQLAHIVGWSTAAGSPRGDDALPPGERNLEANLMLVCYDQHRVIDNRSMWEVYDVATLRAMKRRHEHRIRQLTDLRDEDRTTVVRVVSNLHGAAVALAPRSVATALLARGQFPDYALVGADEFEIDLRTLAGERAGTPAYWTAGRDLIAERLRLLATHVRKEQVRHLSVFAIARIPLLIALGTLLDDAVPTEIYPKRRDAGEGWGWTPGADPVDFEFARLRVGTDPSRVAVLFSLSGTVDPLKLPAEIDDTTTLYEVRPAGETPSPDLVRAPESLDHFGRCWRDLLATLERDHPGLPGISVFPAVPVTAAIAIGRSVMRAAHPPLRIFDRNADTDTYQYALETSR